MRTLFIFGLTLFPFLSLAQVEKPPLTADQILNLVIRHYDPDERWARYRGEMHLYTIRPNGGSSEEDLILDNASSFYQSTLFVDDHVIERKLSRDKAFFEVDGRGEILPEVVARYNLNEAGLRQIAQHHRVHFGLPMYLREAGIDLAPKARLERFNDMECWVLTFTGDPAGRDGAYFTNPIHLYINPSGYQILGMRYENDEGSLPDSYVVFGDEIEVNGIRIPKIKTYYRTRDDSYWFTDVFYPFTRRLYEGEEAAKASIRKLLEEETIYFYARDYENWATCWSHQEDVFFSYVSKMDYTIKKGWEALSQHMRDYMQDNPDPHQPPIERSDYVFHLQGNLAWVYFKNREGEATGQHQRVLRKENGNWKIINMTGIDEGSYLER